MKKKTVQLYTIRNCSAWSRLKLNTKKRPWERCYAKFLKGHLNELGLLKHYLSIIVKKIIIKARQVKACLELGTAQPQHIISSRQHAMIHRRLSSTEGRLPPKKMRKNAFLIKISKSYYIWCLKPQHEASSITHYLKSSKPNIEASSIAQRISWKLHVGASSLIIIWFPKGYVEASSI